MDLELIIEHLKCPVCKQVFKSPKRLPCGHNVCQRCLKCHIIRTVPKTGCKIQDYGDGHSLDIKPESHSFKCPIDEKEIRMPIPIDNVNEWVHQFENNLNIVTLVEIFQGQSRCTIEICDNCREVSQSTFAVSVCFTCFKKFCIRCTYIHRNTHRKDFMCNLTTFQQNGNDKSTYLNSSKTTKTCKIHLFFELTLFCMDCKSRCCKMCKRTLHNECHRLLQLRHLIDEPRRHGTSSELTDRLTRVLEQITEILKDDLELVDKVEKFKASGVDSENKPLTDLKTKLCNKITYWQTQYEHLKKSLLFLNEDRSLDVHAEMILQTEVICQQAEEELRLHKNKDDSKILEKIKDALKTSSKERNEKYGEHSQTDRRSTVSNVETLYLKEISYSQLEHNPEKEVVDVTQKIQLVEKIDMKVQDDITECWLTDCVFVHESYILVADNANKSLKWKMGTAEVRKLILPSGPQCIAIRQIEVEEHEGCVTLPADKIIQLFHIDSNEMRLTDHFEVKEMCYGVDFIDDHIIVSCKGNECSVKILTKAGVELRTFSHCETSSKERLFRDPRNVRVQKRARETRLFVTDFRLCTLTCLTLKGLEVAASSETIIHHMGFPLGVDESSDGSILVSVNSRGEIHQIVDGFEQTRLLVRSLWQPRGVSVLKKGNKFMVTTDSGHAQSCVLIYEFKSRAC